MIGRGASIYVNQAYDNLHSLLHSQAGNREKDRIFIFNNLFKLVYITRWQDNIQMYVHIDGLVQERCNSGALAMELIFLAPTHQYVLPLFFYM